MDPNAIIITTGDFALIKDSVSSAWTEVSSGSADDFMKKGPGQFEAIEKLDQHLKKIQPPINKQQVLSRTTKKNQKSNPVDPKIKALKAISAKVKKIFDDFKKGDQSLSPIKIPQFVLVLDDQNSTTESAINGQTAARVVESIDGQLSSTPRNVPGQTPASEGKSGSPRTLREQREASQRLSDKGLNSVSGARARVISGGQNIGHGEDLPVEQRHRVTTNNSNPQNPRGNPGAVFGTQSR